MGGRADGTAAHRDQRQPYLMSGPVPTWPCRSQAGFTHPTGFFSLRLACSEQYKSTRVIMAGSPTPRRMPYPSGCPSGSTNILPLLMVWWFHNSSHNLHKFYTSSPPSFSCEDNTTQRNIYTLMLLVNACVLGQLCYSTGWCITLNGLE
jgi:hypothetical protein